MFAAFISADVQRKRGQQSKEEPDSEMKHGRIDVELLNLQLW